MYRTNIASRAARWSAKHRRAAILGWIAFVVISLGLGSAIGTQTIADEDLGNGESREGEQVLADAGFPEKAAEEVFDPESGRPSRRRRRVQRRDSRRRAAAG